MRYVLNMVGIYTGCFAAWMQILSLCYSKVSKRKHRKLRPRRLKWQSDKINNVLKVKRTCMMKKEKKERIMNCISFDDLLNERCGCEEMPE